jgi:hypothetical protein
MKINEIKNIFSIRKFKKKDKWTEIVCLRHNSLFLLWSSYIFYCLVYLPWVLLLCVVVGVIIFGSVRFLLKKVTKTGFFLKKRNRNRTETDSNWPVSVRFGYFGEKTGSNRFGSVCRRLAQFGSVVSGFFRFGFDLVWFSFFGFRLIKPNWTEPVSFFKILIGFISQFDFFGYFYFWFSQFNRFFGFFPHPYVVVLDCY